MCVTDVASETLLCLTSTQNAISISVTIMIIIIIIIIIIMIIIKIIIMIMIKMIIKIMIIMIILVIIINLYFTRVTQSNTGFDFRCGLRFADNIFLASGHRVETSKFLAKFCFPFYVVRLRPGNCCLYDRTLVKTTWE